MPTEERESNRVDAEGNPLPLPDRPANSIPGVEGLAQNEREALLDLIGEMGTRATQYFRQAGEANDATYNQDTASGLLRGAAIQASPDTTASIQAEYDAITGGISEYLIDAQGSHEREMLRMEAANSAYMDALAAAVPIHAQQMDKAIDLAELYFNGGPGGGTGGRSGGGGGRGGGGGGSGGGGESIFGDGEESQRAVDDFSAGGIFGPQLLDLDRLTGREPELMSDQNFMDLEDLMGDLLDEGLNWAEAVAQIDENLAHFVEQGLIDEREAESWSLALANQWASVFPGGIITSQWTGQQAPFGSEEGRALLEEAFFETNWDILRRDDPDVANPEDPGDYPESGHERLLRQLDAYHNQVDQGTRGEGDYQGFDMRMADMFPDPLGDVLGYLGMNEGPRFGIDQLGTEVPSGPIAEEDIPSPGAPNPLLPRSGGIGSAAGGALGDVLAQRISEQRAAENAQAVIEAAIAERERQLAIFNASQAGQDTRGLEGLLDPRTATPTPSVPAPRTITSPAQLAFASSPTPARTQAEREQQLAAFYAGQAGI